jgi:hypothetical protein
MDDFDLEWMERVIAGDIASMDDGAQRINWTNERMSQMVKALRERDALIEEIQTALISLLPGYQQYLDWAAERGTMFLKDGKDVLRRAYAASKLPPPDATKAPE